jgi:2,3-bisphosphoglycerate-independent phosphoglycerate mutase
MLESDGSPFTAHTTNQVPFVVIGNAFKHATLKEGGILADVAPTLLDMMGLEKPAEMTGNSLLNK